VGTAATGQQEDRSDTGVKREGHGRNAAAAYIGAQKVQIPHPSLSRGDACPSCAGGKVYPMKDPGVRVRFSGVAPLQAKVYECARLRCGLCGEMYTANTPEGVGEQKYDETVPAVVGLLRYGVGLPFSRIEKLQANFGIPLASSTQWSWLSLRAPRIALCTRRCRITQRKEPSSTMTIPL
jgi:transposase